VLGVGLGPGQSVFNLAIQNAAPMNRLGVVTSASQFFRQIGATIGIAIFGTLFTNNLNTKLAANPLGQMIPNLDIGKLQEFAAKWMMSRPSGARSPARRQRAPAASMRAGSSLLRRQKMLSSRPA